MMAVMNFDLFSQFMYHVCGKHTTPTITHRELVCIMFVGNTLLLPLCIENLCGLHEIIEVILLH